MAPARRKGSGRAAAAAAAARQQWKVGDLVLAKMKGFPAWPAMVSEPEKWGFSSDRRKLLVYFYGTKQIAFCNYADIEAFTEEKKKSLLSKRQGKGADFVRAVDEIVDIYENLKREAHDRLNSGDEGTVSSGGNSEGSKNQAVNRSPEHGSYIGQSHQSTLCVVTESHDVCATEELPTISLQGDRHDMSTTVEPTVKISILDQLRQTPLVTTSNLRKRRRDAQLKGSAIQEKALSFRRSRSSSGGHPHKFQKPTTILNSSHTSGDDVKLESVMEESLSKEKTVEQIPLVSASQDAHGSFDFPNNETCDHILSETTSLKSEVINLNDGSMLESNCKVEHPGNGHSEGIILNGDVSLNNELDLAIKTVVKRKRRPIRKRVTNMTGSAQLKREVDSQVELGRTLSGSPDSHSEANKIPHSIDGDEHLPLVKRARVRMSKPPLEETHLEGIVCTEEGNNSPANRTEEGSDMAIAYDKPDDCMTSTSCENQCHSNNTSTDVKETLSSPANNCTLSSGRDAMFWKINKYQFKGVELDVESALPPSKRLCRALEAMSANAAENLDDCPKTLEETELVSNNCLDSPKVSRNISCEGKVGSHAETDITQPSDCNLPHSNASQSCLTSQNPEELPITPPGRNFDKFDSKDLSNSCNKECIENVVDCEENDDLLNSSMAIVHTHENIYQPCSNLIEKGSSVSDGNISEKIPSEDLPKQLPLSLGKENVNQILPPSEKCPYSGVDSFSRDGPIQLFCQKTNSPMKSNEVDNILHLVGVASTSMIAKSTASNASKMKEFSNCHSNGVCRTRDLQDVGKEVGLDVEKGAKPNSTPKDWGISPDLTHMKDLIAAAQAKRLLSRSTSFPDNIIDRKVAASPLLINRKESYGQGSSPNSKIYHIPPDDGAHCIQNGGKSPHSSRRPKNPEKISSQAEVNGARKTFEALLCTLSRTKESISRATRCAIDCARHGIAGEVVDILLQYLEREPSLYRRVDLFFLVDSITQCSRSQKGGAGDVYPFLVQSVLPRLLIAAAPPGHSAWENRRQCLKVLRVWLERKTLPDSIIRHHVRELESANEASFPSSYSRRPSRTERAINDPVREMEGMLVDEYGSNTSFQLPSFLHSNVLEDEEGNSDDEKCFEAVTPESSPKVDDDKIAAQFSTEKHCHVLEDVDGELEMEDLAPYCEVGASSMGHIAGTGTVGTPHYLLDNHPAAFAPPLPDDKPPSPPPLPSSPPPMAPSGSNPQSLVSQNVAGSHAFDGAVDYHLSRFTHNMQNKPAQSICQQPSVIDSRLTTTEVAQYCCNGGLPTRLPSPVPSLASCSYNNPGPGPASHTGNTNNVQPLVSIPLPNKGYNLHTPAPVSNHFYPQAEPCQTQTSWRNCSSSTDRFQYIHDDHRGNIYMDRTGGGSLRPEISERGIVSPAVPSGLVLSDKAEALPSRPPYGTPSEPSAVAYRGWPLPPRMPSYSVPASRPMSEYQLSRVAGAPGFWRPR